VQYECTQCGQLSRFVRTKSRFVTACPVCEEPTAWTPAFESDEGVSF
jgi:predicted  nucleic acid-binding Zn-ribbon protein